MLHIPYPITSSINSTVVYRGSVNQKLLNNITTVADTCPGIVCVLSDHIKAITTFEICIVNHSAPWMYNESHTHNGGVGLTHTMEELKACIGGPFKLIIVSTIGWVHASMHASSLTRPSSVCCTRDSLTVGHFAVSTRTIHSLQGRCYQEAWVATTRYEPTWQCSHRHTPHTHTWTHHVHIGTHIYTHAHTSVYGGIHTDTDMYAHTTHSQLYIQDSKDV